MPAGFIKMRTITALFSIALCLAVIDLSCAESEHHDHQRQTRHRPKRQYPIDYGFQHHPAWYRPRYPEDRRDDRSQQDLLPHIYRLLEEISDLVRRPPPPPPPQPIYIPYPMQYPCPQRCKCPTGLNGTPNVTNRFPEMEDVNQNWGYDDSEEPEDNVSNARPINFDPIAPPSITSRPPPAVEHGTSQGSAQQGRVRVNSASARRPTRCDGYVFVCCEKTQSKQQQRSCFVSANCGAYYEKRDVCSNQSVQEVLDLYAATYAPAQ